MQMYVIARYCTLFVQNKRGAAQVTVCHRPTQLIVIKNKTKYKTMSTTTKNQGGTLSVLARYTAYLNLKWLLLKTFFLFFSTNPHTLQGSWREGKAHPILFILSSNPIQRLIYQPISVQCSLSIPSVFSSILCFRKTVVKSLSLTEF